MQRMDRLRRSLRESFRRKRDGPESSKPHQWQADEEAVRSGNCSFHVKYLGCVEVFESRGMQVCEEAMKVLRQSRRRPVKSTLHISGDGLRVVEDDTKGLIVDQTIEKVSFCAPDRNHERGFSYICRDGTTRRWMCHGFVASKDSGERLSHAVGCAFAVCLERKQKREKECGVSMTFDNKSSTFTRSGSFRVGTATDNLSTKSLSPPPSAGPTTGNKAPTTNATTGSTTSSSNPHAIERPHAPPKMLERQGSFRGFSQLANRSPFKRQLSLRLNELPSNLQRTQPSAVDILTANNIIPIAAPFIPAATSTTSPAPPPRTQRSRLASLPNSSLAGGVIPEIPSHGGSTENTVVPTKIENKDLVSQLCQQVTQGLSMLAANHDDIKNVSDTLNSFPTKFTNPWDDEVSGTQNRNSVLPVFNTAPLTKANSVISTGSPTKTQSTLSQPKPTVADTWLNNLTQSHEPKAPLQSKISPFPDKQNEKSTAYGSNFASSANNSNLPPKSASGSIVSSVTVSNITTGGGTVASPPSFNSLSGVKTSASFSHNTTPSSAAPPNIIPGQTVQSGTAGGLPPRSMYRGAPTRSQSLGADPNGRGQNDPFETNWANEVAKQGQAPTNPFVRQQTFQVSM